jgi:hypothetical protein
VPDGTSVPDGSNVVINVNNISNATRFDLYEIVNDGTPKWIAESNNPGNSFTVNWWRASGAGNSWRIRVVPWNGNVRGVPQYSGRVVVEQPAVGTLPPPVITSHNFNNNGNLVITGTYSGGTETLTVFHRLGNYEWDDGAITWTGDTFHATISADKLQPAVLYTITVQANGGGVFTGQHPRSTEINVLVPHRVVTSPNARYSRTDTSRRLLMSNGEETPHFTVADVRCLNTSNCNGRCPAYFTFDPRLVDVLHNLQVHFADRGRVEVNINTSDRRGFRCTSTGQHGKGMAADVRIIGVSREEIYDFVVNQPNVWRQSSGTGRNLQPSTSNGTNATYIGGTMGGQNVHVSVR